MFHFKENYCFLRFQRVPSFSKGVELISAVGVRMLISIETYRTYDFQEVQTQSNIRIRA